MLQTTVPTSTFQLQWLGESGFRLRVKTNDEMRTVYVDADLQNAMLPQSLRRRFQDDIVPEDASLVLITHNLHKNMVQGLSLTLAAADADCQIVCPSEVATTLRQSNMIPSAKIQVPALDCSLSFGSAKLALVHSRDKKSGILPPGKDSSCSGSNASAGSDSSSASATSLSGMTTSGWVINLGEGGPRIYHTGDTMDLKQMKLVEQMYAPTHVLIPMGARCSLGPSEAAIACTEYLRTCHTVIPLLMRPTPCDSSEQSDGASLGPSATTLPLSCQLRQQIQKQAFGVPKRVIDSEQEILGHWIKLTP